MTRAPVIAAARMKATSHDDPGWCLRTVRGFYGVGPVYPTAAEAWRHTVDRFRHWPPPPGAPVWWTGGDGHVAISVGGGYVVTTDNPLEGAGEIGVCPIATITQRWDKVFQGWSYDLDDEVVYRWATVDLSELRRAALTDPAAPQGHQTYPHGVRLVEAALYLLGYLPRRWAFDGSFGTATLDAYSRWQRRLGYHGSVDQPGSDADGVPGSTSLAALADRYRWKVVA